MKARLPLGTHVGLKHGAGGRAMRSLVEQLFIEGAQAPPGCIGLEAMDDGAAFPVGDRWLVVTTDSHVVYPRFFPGGDLGRLAISGTVNDLAMMGATEVLGLACAIVLEDGFPIAELERIQASMRPGPASGGATACPGRRGAGGGAALRGRGAGHRPAGGRDRPAGAVLRCPECECPAQLESGDELVLERLELEVPQAQTLRPQ